MGLKSTCPSVCLNFKQTDGQVDGVAGGRTDGQVEGVSCPTVLVAVVVSTAGYEKMFSLVTISGKVVLG